eukprot:TRINITY_DN9291_c0_g2_i1.p1 TRINITY_DN9291_c0_g2~~TRINITY_DN9291_c0_g2_i1.p1  ORF type:complete len:1204 (+),score=281.47 TRINITY_DN9291_c0_g2_i1:31-3612(+)
MESVIEAIRVAHDECANSEVRNRAKAACDEFKNLPDAYTCAFHLMHQRHEPLVRLFGESVMDYVVKNKWNDFQYHTRVEIRNALLSFMVAGTKEVLEEQVFIKEKFVAVLVEIAKRDWPTTWKTLWEDVSGVAQKGDKQLELSLLFFGALAQDIHDFNQDLPKNRIRLLSNALDEIVGRILDFYYKAIEMSFGKFQQAKSVSDSHSMKLYHKIMSAGLKGLQSYIEWIPLTQIEGKRNLWHVFCLLLSDISVRTTSAECLILLLSRAEKKEKLKQLALFDFVPLIIRSMSINSDDFDNDYAFQKRVSQLLSLLGIKHLQYCQTQFIIPPNYETFLEVMLQVSAHPSMTITSFMLPFWIALLKQREIVSQDGFTNLLGQLLNAIDNKNHKLSAVFKAKFGADASRDFQEIKRRLDYDKHDHETASEWSESFLIFRNSLVQCYKTMTKTFPGMVLSYLEQKTIRDVAKVKAGLEGNAQSITLAQIEMESLRHVISAIIGEVPSEVLEEGPNSPYYVLVQNILKPIFDLSTGDAVVTKERLITLTCFGAYYKTDSSSVGYILSAVIEQMTYMAPDETNLWNLSKSTIDTRREAGKALLNLCKTMSGKLLENLDQLTSVISNMFLNNSLLTGEQILAVRCLVALSNGMKSYEAQASFLSTVLQPTINDWTSPAVSSVVKKMSSLLTFLGANSSESPYEVRKRSEKLAGLLQSFFVTWTQSRIPQDPQEKIQGGYVPRQIPVSFAPPLGNVMIPVQSSYPLSQHVPVIFPNICALVRTLHQLWTPPGRSEVPPEFQSLYKIDAKRYFGLVSENENEKTTSSVPVHQLVSQNIDHVRIYSYKLLEFFAMQKEGLFTLPQLPELLVNSFFCHLDRLEPHHLSLYLNHVVRPLAVYLPQELYAVFLPMLHEVLLICFQVLNSEWKKQKDSKSKFKSNEENADDMVREKTLRDATRTYAQVTKEILLQSSTNSSQNAAPSPFSNFGQPVAPKVESNVALKLEPTAIFTFYLKTGTLHKLIFDIINCLSFEDTQTNAKCTYILDIIVPYIFQDSTIPFEMKKEYVNLFASTLLSMVLMCLTEENSEEHQENMVGLAHVIFFRCWELKDETASGVLMKMPNITQERYGAFWKRYEEAKAEKGKKSVFRQFLTETVGIKMGSMIFKKQSNILDIPDQFWQHKLEAKPEEEEDDGIPYDLIALFGL